MTELNLRPFLDTWYENKPRALLFTTKKEAPLLLKIVAFKYRHYVGTGYVQVLKSQEVRAKFKASKYGPTFIIFKENTSSPHLFLQVKVAWGKCLSTPNMIPDCSFVGALEGDVPVMHFLF